MILLYDAAITATVSAVAAATTRHALCLTAGSLTVVRSIIRGPR